MRSNAVRAHYPWYLEIVHQAKFAAHTRDIGVKQVRAEGGSVSRDDTLTPSAETLCKSRIKLSC